MSRALEEGGVGFRIQISNRHGIQDSHSSKILTIQQGITRGVSSVGKPCRPEHGFPRQTARVMHRYFKSMFFVLRSDSGYVIVELTIPC